MFGSLVFTLSTPHTGGNLLLRHRNRSFDFNASSLLESAPSSSVAYVAFYSDVQHEVLEVTSGARITITFNLYYDPSRAPPVMPAKRIPIPENQFMHALREAYRDAAFVRGCTHIGFGLEHQYPRNVSDYRYPVWSDLKGADAFVFNALRDTGSNPVLWYLYESASDSWGNSFDLLLSRPVNGRDEEDIEDEEMQYLLEQDDEALIVWREDYSEETLDKAGARCYKDRARIDDYRSRSIHVQWVTPPSANLAGETIYTESGNEPIQEIYYYKVCIIVDLGSVQYPGA